ncbi:hypothetical protein WJU23_09975 [Prosthecobacter sp. SYSU 5D2]|uniref:hypothetical protein n=1 Tax=Prosthecobacter sp. SYSU 5D2 TaxID=3134134 RepID=UPI0031FF2783
MRAIFILSLLLNLHTLDAAELEGKFVLSVKPFHDDAYDAIEFLPDGNCILHNKDTGVAGSFKLYSEERLMIEQRSFVNEAKIFKMRLTDNLLILDQGDDKRELRYIKIPKGPHPSSTDLVGTTKYSVTYKTHQLENVAHLSADFTYSLKMRVLWPENQTYLEFTEEGTWKCSNGIVTYRVNKTNSPWLNHYYRELYLKAGPQGLTFLDAIKEAIAVAPAVTTMELPAAPSGYTLIKPKE